MFTVFGVTLVEAMSDRHKHRKFCFSGGRIIIHFGLGETMVACASLPNLSENSYMGQCFFAMEFLEGQNDPKQYSTVSENHSDPSRRALAHKDNISVRNKCLTRIEI